MPRYAIWAIACLALSALAIAATPEEVARWRADEELLRRAGLRTDGPGLVEFFRKRTASDANRAQMEKLAATLRTGKPAERARAANELDRLGYKALPILQAAERDGDAQTIRLVKPHLARVKLSVETDRLRAAASLLRQRKPAGAAAAVLAFLPSLHDAAAENELFRTVAALGGGDQPEKFLADAASSRVPRQRAAAAWALGRSKRPQDRDRAASLLRDESPPVRYRAAEALVFGHDRRGIPGLIEALALDGEAAGQAEALLVRLAGENAPEAALDGEGPAAKRQAAWRDWYGKHGSTLDLARADLTNSLLGLRLVVSDGVWEYGPDHKVRRHRKNLGGVLDARALPGGRLLLADYTARRVTERDAAGKVVWEYPTGDDGPIEVQRLSGGNTLVTTATEIREVTPDRRVVYLLRANRDDEFFSGQKLPGGNVVYGLASGAVVELVPRGPEVARFKVEPPTASANVVVLKEGRYLLPYQRTGRVVEVDRGGRVQREIRLASPGTLAPLPGGGLLVGSHAGKSVRELDAAGKVVWERSTGAFVYRVRCR